MGRVAVQHAQSLLEVFRTQADGYNVLFVGTCIGHDPPQACIAMPDVALRLQSGLSGMWSEPLTKLCDVERVPHFTHLERALQ